MKHTTSFATIVFTAASIFAVPSFAESSVVYPENSYVSRARVVESTPIIETVYEEREVCRYKYVSERQQQRGQDDLTEKVVGGVIGGAAGSAVGKGSGRDAAAAVGAILGSEVAAQDGELSEGELIGGVVGGIVGNQVGGGSGKTAATAAGALIGAIVGDNIQNGGVQEGEVATERRRKVRVCDIEETPKKVITGYEVTFEYGNHYFSQWMSKEPGAHVDINVSVEALEERTSVR